MGLRGHNYKRNEDSGFWIHGTHVTLSIHGTVMEV